MNAAIDAVVECAADARILQTAIATKTPQNKPVTHLRFVDGLRGLAALYVVLTHAWLQTCPQGACTDISPGRMSIFTSWLNHGNSAVTVFIVISGFCLMLPALRNGGTLGSGGALRFYLRRAKRILPPYYAALLLSILLVVALISNHTQTLFDLSLPMTSGGVASHLALLHNLHPATEYQINGPLWSIAVECQIYLLFPLLIATRRRHGTVALLLWAFIVALTLHALVHGSMLKGLMPLYLFQFVLGMYAAEVATGVKKLPVLWIGAGAGILSLLLLLFYALRQTILSDLLTGLIAAGLLAGCAHWPNNWIARVVSSSQLVKLGAFSYSLYLIHFPLQQVIWQHLVLPLNLGRRATFGVMLTGGTALILFLSFLFYTVFERPFIPVNRAATRPKNGGRIAEFAPSAQAPG